MTPVDEHVAVRLLAFERQLFSLSFWIEMPEKTRSIQPGHSCCNARVECLIPNEDGILV
jgi:hypothetical protein